MTKTGKKLENDVANSIIFHHKMKKKIELILDLLVKHYKLSDYISENLSYRISLSDLMESKLYEFYLDARDMYGKKLPYDMRIDLETQDFEHWLYLVCEDYMETSRIYSEFIRYKKISQKDINELNLLYENWRYTNFNPGIPCAHGRLHRFAIQTVM